MFNLQNNGPGSSSSEMTDPDLRFGLQRVRGRFLIRMFIQISEQRINESTNNIRTPSQPLCNGYRSPKEDSCEPRIELDSQAPVFQVYNVMYIYFIYDDWTRFKNGYIYRIRFKNSVRTGPG